MWMFSVLAIKKKKNVKIYSVVRYAVLDAAGPSSDLLIRMSARWGSLSSGVPAQPTAHTVGL